MTIEAAEWWSKRKFACVSLTASLMEIFIVYGAVALVQISARQRPTPLILNVATTAWLIGTLGSFGFAVASLVADSDRVTAFVALIVAILVFSICGLQMLV